MGKHKLVERHIHKQNSRKRNSSNHSLSKKRWGISVRVQRKDMNLGGICGKGDICISILGI